MSLRILWLCQGFLKNEGVDRDIVGDVGFLSTDDSTSDLEDFVLDIIESDLLVFAFCENTKEILLKVFLMSSD